MPIRSAYQRYADESVLKPYKILLGSSSPGTPGAKRFCRPAAFPCFTTRRVHVRPGGGRRHRIGFCLRGDPAIESNGIES